MHEVAHFYWHSSSQEWVDEGAAEFMNVAYAERSTGPDYAELLASSFLAGDYDCTEVGTLSVLEGLSGPQAEDCDYTPGRTVLPGPTAGDWTRRLPPRLPTALPHEQGYLRR